MAIVVFVLGTGTNVGKTHVTAALLARARDARQVSAFKPVATGVGQAACDGGRTPGEDTEVLGAIAGTPIEPPVYRLIAPISPHAAAREEGVEIRIDALVRAVQSVASKVDLLLVESAGGLFTPLSNNETNLDLACALKLAFGPNLRHLLVAPNRLGVLHDTGATIRAARAGGVALPHIALSAPEQPDASTGSNAAELMGIGLASTVTVFPRGRPEGHDNRTAAESCLDALDLSVFTTEKRTREPLP